MKSSRLANMNSRSRWHTMLDSCGLMNAIARQLDFFIDESQFKNCRVLVNELSSLMLNAEANGFAYAAFE